MARKQWVVTGSDDMFIRVYNYNTMDKVKAFEAHTDYIRQVLISRSAPRSSEASQAASQQTSPLMALAVQLPL